MSSKPTTTEAMRQIIDEVRQTLPLDLSPVEVCSDDCRSCSIKLIEFISTELESWEQRLNEGDIPNFRDLNRLANSSRKVYNALLKNDQLREAMQHQPNRKV